MISLQINDVNETRASSRLKQKDVCLPVRRRSSRDPSLTLLERRDVKQLIKKIEQNHQDTVILKIKDHILADISSSVLDLIITALWKNRVCQALYMQNLSKSMQDAQLKSLIVLLQKKSIWCLNIGENYEVTQSSWKFFCHSLRKTSITHLYVSEHVIKLELKNAMRDNIRVNRKKHNLHCSLRNIKVIEKCTNLWWNPINSIRHQLDQNLIVPKIEYPTTSDVSPKKQKQVVALTEKHTAYWAEGYGKGGDIPWKFSCVCGEKCSSYENYRYHPVGRQYECVQCNLWSHVSCVLGNVSNEYIDESEDLLCSACRGKARRERLSEIKRLHLVYIDGNVRSIHDEKDNCPMIIYDSDLDGMNADNTNSLIDETNTRFNTSANKNDFKDIRDCNS